VRNFFVPLHFSVFPTSNNEDMIIAVPIINFWVKRVISPCSIEIGTRVLTCYSFNLLTVIEILYLLRYKAFCT